MRCMRNFPHGGGAACGTPLPQRPKLCKWQKLDHTNHSLSPTQDQDVRGNGSNSVSRLGRQPRESLRHRRGLGWSRPARLFRRSSPANTPRVVQVAIFAVPLVGIATGRICCHESVGGEPWLRSGTIFTAPHRPEFVQVPSPTGAESLHSV